MTRIKLFFAVWRQYASAHNPIYAARIAFGVAFKNLPF